MMRGRRRHRLALALAFTMAAGALPWLALPACYDVPQPDCGFRCGPDGACPEDYTCSTTDGRCHLNGTPASLVCGSAAGDAGIDAQLAPDDER
jgi:hypothetical protein